MSNVSVGSANAAFVTPATDVLNTYNRRNNMHDAIREFPKLLDDLQSPAVRDRLQRAGMDVTQTIEAFEKCYETDYVVFQLAMSMSPLAFRSVLSGTVAWQAAQTTRFDWYSAAGPGVYAVGIAVDSRGGKFLSAQEMGRLAQGFDQYSAGYDALQTAFGQRTLSQRRDVSYLRRVDNAISNFAGLPSSGRSIVNSTEQQHVLMFAERLRERAKAILSVDPTGQVIQLQSPLCIGSSDKMEKTTRDYIGPANHSNINKLLVLALNVLKTMNLPSSLHVRPVIRIWEQHQLPYAERLVATLAESLVAQNGFNTAEAGGLATCQASETELLAAKSAVFSMKPFLRQHIDGVNTVLQDRLRFIQEVKRLSQYLSNLQQEIDETEQQLRSFMALKPIGWTAGLSMLQSKQQKLCQQTDMLVDWKVRLQAVIGLQNAMLPQLADSRAQLPSSDTQGSRVPAAPVIGQESRPLPLSSSPVASVIPQTDPSSSPGNDEMDVD
ncbi:hypothetical protein MHUMG1_07971 [Metarhizium humberi]|uniref:Uncharacterized protein n=1 Tax=Metarhizium humberi TaxID=2596975 RepID=A0A9P8M5X5_9HYPO|nr:hypothetical protein MHUMG1_07971 [Metarhizium humberi]